jgi:hypothetical protein
MLSVWILSVAGTSAQIIGEVIDATDGGPIPYASVVYKGNNVVAKANGNGQFSISRHNGWRLTFSSVGYQSQVINVGPSTPQRLTIRLKADNQRLEEVTVKSKRKTRYRRKDNPAVELMRKVIAAKKKTNIKHHDYYSYKNYQKITMGLNDLSVDIFERSWFKKFPWLADQVEVSPYNDKLVLPLTVDETVTEHYYRKSPEKEKAVIIGQKSSGVNDLFQTGEILTTVTRDVFADVDIYDDYILLLRHKFSSPIGRDAIQFYRYYITDTVFVGNDRCIAVDFLPNNQQDFGFRGQIYILDDSSYQVKRCELTIPRSSDVNWVEGMQCMQEFTQQPNGEWLLTVDDMIVELMVTDFIARAFVTRTTRLTDFSFDPLTKKQMKGGEQETQRGANNRDEAFWESHRQVEFTKSERQMGSFLDHIEQLKGYKIGIFLMKALFENYLETGSRDEPSRFDVGPINTMISQNFYDGLRMRVTGQTTANLNPHLFWKGYYAYGTRHKEHYYNTEFTYSFMDREYLPQEFPLRNISFASKRDVALPSDKYVSTDKDNVFASFKAFDADKMFLYNTQKLGFDYETSHHLRISTSLKAEKMVPIGDIAFLPNVADALPLQQMRTTEATVGLRLAPDEKFINTKQRRRTINQDAWVLSLQHTTGFNHFLGGQYDYNYTQFEYSKRTWLPMSWGRIDLKLRAAAQWNKVPYPLLVIPQANLSYILDYGAFSSMNNMEFLTDRYASLMINWEMGGKLFNRIPLLRKLKWREVIEFKGMWGKLTDKNNPDACPGDSRLMRFPTGSYAINPDKPYMEWAVGVQNILNLIQIEYVRRINYLDLPTAQKHGIRFVVNPTF